MGGHWSHSEPFLPFLLLLSCRNIRLQTRPLAPARPSTTMNSSPHGSRASIDILEELQLIAAQNLEKLDINKYYEVVCELGKGTYGKVDLVIHKIRGNCCVFKLILTANVGYFPCSQMEMSVRTKCFNQALDFPTC